MLRSKTTHQFIRFGLVGTLGFLVDTTALYLFLFLGSGYYLGRIGSFLCAATFTWYLNRNITFQNNEGSAHRQWLGFLGANAIGGFINLAVYSLLIMNFDLVRSFPVLGVAAGAIFGLMFNFTLSKKFIFRS